MDGSIHDYVVEGLQKTKGHWNSVAEETGISKRTLEKIARREIKNPGVAQIETLAKYFRERDAA